MDIDIDTDWYDLVADEVREEMDAVDEGSVWLLFLDEACDPRVGFALPAIEEIGEAEYDALVGIVDDVDAPGLLVVVPRDDGLPLAVDWRLWEELRGRLAVSRTELVDLLVVGRHCWWAARRSVVLDRRPSRRDVDRVRQHRRHVHRGAAFHERHDS